MTPPSQLADRPAAIGHGGLRPQEWHDVTAPPPGIALAAARVVAACGHGTLDPDALCRLVAGLALRHDLWQPLAVSDRTRRRYRLMLEDARLDIWVLSWMPGQATGYHDHGSSNVALTTLQGAVRERRIRVERASSASSLRASSGAGRPDTSTRSRTARARPPSRSTPTPRRSWRSVSTAPPSAESSCARCSTAGRNCSTTRSTRHARSEGAGSRPPGFVSAQSGHMRA